jgi:hypothetical protein
MTSKFEQLIEFVINDEEAKAKELFHDIVVEKSREIYENLMNEEDAEEVEESAEEDEESIEESMEEEEENMEESFGGDAADEMIKDVDSDEDSEEDSADEFDAGEEEANDEGNMEDRVVDLEDKLDELMAEFEALMGNEAGEESDEEFGMEPTDDEVGGDAYAQDDTADFADTDVPMTENIDLVKVAAPQHGDNGANAKSPTAFNSGAAGMQGKPVKNTASESNPDGTAAYKKPSNAYSKGEASVKGAGSFKNVPAKDGSKLEAVAKPKGGDNGSNTRSPLPKG